MVGVGSVAVEEVLGVEAHLAARRHQPGHRVLDHQQVLVERGAQYVVHLAVPGLADQGDDRRRGVEQRAQLEVVLGTDARPAGRPERRQPGMLEPDTSNAGEELGVGLVGTGPAALDDADPDAIEVLGDPQLVGHREVDADALGAVAQGGVVDLERHQVTPAALRRWAGSAATTAAPAADVEAVPPRSAVSTPSSMQASTAPSSAAARSGRAERVAQHQRDAEDGAVGIGPVHPGDLRGAAMDRLEEPGPDSPRLADGSRPSDPASTAASSLRMSPNRFSVTTTSMSPGRCTSRIANESTRACSSVTVGYSRGEAGNDVTPQLAWWPGRWLCRRREPAAALRRQGEGDAGDALHLSARVHDAVDREVDLAALRLAEVRTAGELSHDDQVHTTHHLGPQRGEVGEPRVSAHRAQVGEDVKPGAQPEQPGLAAPQHR